MTQLIDIIARLRKECPWDRAQTHESLAAPLIEEAYEAVEAIETQNYPELKKELGDLLLHVLFHADLAREEGHFTLDDVVQAECDKLIYRHPHVFGTTEVHSADDVSRNWEQLKRKETGRTSILDGVPTSLPSLQRATRIQEKASKVGFDWDNKESVIEKVREEFEEFITATTDTEREEEFGDLLFSLVNFSRHQKIEAERALRAATIKFDKRFRQVEQLVEASRKPWNEYTLEELDQFWNKAKEIKN
ncbi:MAG TPA: nucleoside triphosphate pyrophosphohydrolase [Candidatus Kapabacteria bacterium]|nr:nucleoside triphosphate pyrophosphohydrolase [Candidatus Kapabacteria bacterium]